MSYSSIHIIPDEDDLRAVRGSSSSGIPAVKVAEHLTIQFQPEDHEFAVRYLTKLGNEALKLAQQIAEAKS